MSRAVSGRRSLRFGVGPVRVGVRWRDPADGPVLRDYFRAFDPPPRARRGPPGPPGPDGPHHDRGQVEYIIDDEGVVRRDDRRVARGRAPSERARAVAFDLGQSVPERAAPALLLHAGAVSRRGRALLLPAPQRGGKSTLVLGLVLRGWTYHSDDLAVVGGARGESSLGTFPRPIDLRPRALELFGRLGPDLRVYPGPGRTGGRCAVRVSRRRVARRPARVRWVVFPHVRLRRPTEIRPLGRAEAAVRLARMACNLDRLGAPGFERLLGLLQGASCYTVEVGRLRDGLRALAQITGAADVASGSSNR